MSRQRSGDAGMTLIELLFSVVVLGLIAVVIAATFLTVLKVTPATEFRIDDARSTRGLQSWLARDVASTPHEPYSTATGTGYADTPALLALVPAGDRCSTDGSPVLFMAWRDSRTEYRADYTIESTTSGTYEVVRTICGGDTGRVSITGDVANTECSGPTPFAAVSYSYLPPAVDPDPGPDGAKVELCFLAVQTDAGLSAGNQAQEIRMSVVSRNGDFA